ncbi:MAG: hypothetical protein L0332_24250 [Chloroflexi bacterium]|nr:hypothetical protein [Chloroflexota bacterium]MCI0648594.1 hypothetical protein [Chloroflexota bacterium]MCI0729807.1 hypothetical protein [Chloroflexota bacterium]
MKKLLAAFLAGIPVGIVLIRVIDKYRFNRAVDEMIRNDPWLAARLSELREKR